MILLALLACPKVEGPETTTADPVAVPAGSFLSGACDARTYERRLVVAADATFTMSDLVSPCPVGATCIWSGIVEYHGTIEAPGTLKYTEEADSRGQARPAQLRTDPGGGLLDDLGCRYSPG